MNWLRILGIEELKSREPLKSLEPCTGMVCYNTSKKNSGEERLAKQNKMITQKHVICSDEMQLEVFAHRDMSMFGERKVSRITQRALFP